MLRSMLYATLCSEDAVCILVLIGLGFEPQIPKPKHHQSIGRRTGMSRLESGVARLLPDKYRVNMEELGSNFDTLHAM